MWKGIAFPTIIMAVAWFLVSTSTTFYIYWLDQSYQRVFAENVASIHASDNMRETVWRLLASVLTSQSNSHATAQRISADFSALEQDGMVLRQLALTDRELNLADRLDEQIRDYQHALSSPGAQSDQSESPQTRLNIQTISGLADELCKTAQQFRDINQELLKTTGEQRERANGSVFAARTSILILGPGLGIYYGWWMGRRFQNSMARITVTLRDATDEERTLGAVCVDPRQDFDSLQSQVELVVSRMRQANDELQHARHEVLRSERLAAVGELAAGLAHELRNPLTSVKLLLQHAAQLGTTESLTNPKLSLILDEISRMESTIQGLLDFSRPPRLTCNRQDVRETLNRAINLVVGRALQQKVEISAELGEVPLTVEADAAQIHQVFVNLLINGLESMPNGGQLQVVAEHRDCGRIIAIQIQDTGPGIAPAIEKRLFEPFATTKERGTGLGLAISRRIIEQHHGTIIATNEPAGGARFQITLPAIPQ